MVTLLIPTKTEKYWAMQSDHDLTQ